MSRTLMLAALYKRVGAQYFFAMANHHDNLDLWDSKYHPWNSVKVGPKKDLVAGWATAARKHGLPFGVSVHASRPWSWYETAQGADKDGPFAGVPYDGKPTKADGKGQWWDGLDPQDLNEQRHEPSPGFDEMGSIMQRWNWENGVSQPDAAYCERFYYRTVDLINRYHPDLIYFDDTALPLWPVSDAGLKIAAHFYNTNIRRHGEANEGILFGKILTDEDVRFTTRNGAIFTIVLGVPEKALSIKSLGDGAGLAESRVADVTQPGSNEVVSWKQDGEGLVIDSAASDSASDATVVYKVTLC